MTADRQTCNLHDVVEPETESWGAAPSLVPAAEPTGSSKVFSPQQKTKSITVKEEVKARRTIGGEPAGWPAMDSSAQSRLQISEWIERIGQGCLAGEVNTQFWEKRYQEGKKLISYESTEDEKLVKDLLPLLEQLQHSSGKSLFVCKRIFKRLEPAPSR